MVNKGDAEITDSSPKLSDKAKKKLIKEYRENLYKKVNLTLPVEEKKED
ncbi:hypothetical protein FDJ25_gp028 [Vibrio phage Aphrodite1]|uniref:Uncharacterized protein n=1 Tax=Vibrio phage Aphrodite1 TaxID=2070057 RepID=A0A2I7QI77_9CAUD|nr:hypothetical protein FDJ25_gp028 [Vibrio phage Aphrodite1]AUR81102.1 hypothetical protein Aphrodite1_0181 [Vibrio phage Aphrodite1]